MKKMMNYKLKRNGFSLVSVMIAGGLIAGLSVVLISISEQSNKVSAKALFDQDTTQIIGEMTTILSDSTNCKNTLLNQMADLTPPGPITKIHDNASTKYQVGNKFGNSNLKVLSYELSDVGTVGVANNETNLIVQFERKKILTTLGNVFRKIKLWVQVDAAKKIINCYSVGSAGMNATSNQNFIIWGDSTCPTGFDTLLSGKVFSSSVHNAGNSGTDLLCSTGITRKIYRVNDAQTAYLWDAAYDCAVCAKPEANFCFTSWGTSSCPTNYTASYTGYMFQHSWHLGGTSGKIICRKGPRVGGIYVVNTSATAYEWINGDPCAECCRNN